MHIEFSEAKSLFNRHIKFPKANFMNASETNHAASYELVRGVWNNYDKIVPDRQTVTNILARLFPDLYNFRTYKPLGDFKDLDKLEMRHKDIYNLWIARSSEDKYWSEHNNRDITILNVLVQQVRRVCREKAIPELSLFMIEKCWAMMMYNMSLGMAAELSISRALVEKYVNNPKYFYAPAPAELESDDIDGIFYYRDTTEIYKRVSIKCYGALSMKSLRKWRFEKKKTKPDLYIGFKNKGDDLPVIIKAEDITPY